MSRRPGKSTVEELAAVRICELEAEVERLDHACTLASGRVTKYVEQRDREATDRDTAVRLLRELVERVKELYPGWYDAKLAAAEKHLEQHTEKVNA